MSILDTIGIIGELLSWIGTITGVPLAIAALIIRAVDGSRLSTSVTIVEDLNQRPIVLWSVQGRIYARSPDSTRRDP